MARSRNIKPSIMDNEELADLNPLTRLLFIYLWMLADREGRLEDRPKRIGAQALPYDRAADVDAMLDELHAAGFIVRYECEGQELIQIVAFAKHQTPHAREAASALPRPEQGITKAVPSHSQGDDTSQVVDSEQKTPRQLQGIAKAVPRHGQDRLIPDSLIPDSLIQINTPHTPQRGARRSAVSFKTWAQQVRESGEKLIPDDDPVFDYAREVELPDDFLTLAWIEFKARYSAEDAKRYKDFRSVFRKAVRGNWFKLWAIDAGGAYYLTTVGKQAERARQEVAA